MQPLWLMRHICAIYAVHVLIDKIKDFILVGKQTKRCITFGKETNMGAGERLFRVCMHKYKIYLIKMQTHVFIRCPTKKFNGWISPFHSV